MRSIRILSLALLTSAAFAPAAFAQDSSSTDTASGKHFAVVGGISLLEPKNDPITGVKKTDGGRRRPSASATTSTITGPLNCGALPTSSKTSSRARTTPAWARSSSSRSR